MAARNYFGRRWKLGVSSLYPQQNKQVEKFCLLSNENNQFHTFYSILIKMVGKLIFFSFVRDGVLFLKPTLTSDVYGENFLTSGMLDIWGSQPSDHCTMNSFYGCVRQGTGSNLINPIMSARFAECSQCVRS